MEGDDVVGEEQLLVAVEIDLALEHLGDGVLYRLLTVLEESMEMSGALLCLSTLSSLLAVGAPKLFVAPSRRSAVAPAAS